MKSGKSGKKVTNRNQAIAISLSEARQEGAKVLQKMANKRHMLYPLEEINNIRHFLLKNCGTLAIAESVTSGHLQAAFSLADDARFFFQGGITTYNLGQKCRHLAVDPIDATKCDCVSDSVARQMAIGVTRLFISHYGIGITGYAAKVPEKNINSLFAYFAISHQGEILISDKIDAPDEEALDVQIYYTRQIIVTLDGLLNKTDSS